MVDILTTGGKVQSITTQGGTPPPTIRKAVNTMKYFTIHYRGYADGKMNNNLEYTVFDETEESAIEQLMSYTAFTGDLVDEIISIETR